MTNIILLILSLALFSPVVWLAYEMRKTTPSCKSKIWFDDYSSDKELKGQYQLARFDCRDINCQFNQGKGKCGKDLPQIQLHQDQTNPNKAIILCWSKRKKTHSDMNK